MKHVELMTGLLLSAGQPLNKKSKIDEIIRGASLGSADLKEAATSVRRALTLVEAVLPDLKTTRFRNGSDFYTLALLLHRFREEGKTITAHGSARNALAGGLLREFGHHLKSDRRRPRLRGYQEPSDCVNCRATPTASRRARGSASAMFWITYSTTRTRKALQSDPATDAPHACQYECILLPAVKVGGHGGRP
jgi:hypothetical protein